MCCVQMYFEQFDSILSAFASLKLEGGSKEEKGEKIRMKLKD